MKPIPLKDVFMEQYNLIALSGSAGLTFATHNPLPLILGVVCEAAYLLFAPDTTYFREKYARAESERISEEDKAKREKFRKDSCDIIGYEKTQRYERLVRMRDQIVDRTNSNAEWYNDIIGKIEGMLDKFLTYSVNEKRFHDHLEASLQQARSHAPAPKKGSKKKDEDNFEYEPGLGNEEVTKWVRNTTREIAACYLAEMEQLKLELSDTQDTLNANSQAMLKKRMSMKEDQITSINRLGENLVEITHRMRLLEDTFSFINDSVSSSRLDDVLPEIDNLIFETNLTTSTMEDIQSYESGPTNKLYA